MHVSTSSVEKARYVVSEMKPYSNAEEPPTPEYESIMSRDSANHNSTVVLIKIYSTAQRENEIVKTWVLGINCHVDAADHVTDNVPPLNYYLFRGDKC